MSLPMSSGSASSSDNGAPAGTALHAAPELMNRSALTQYNQRASGSEAGLNSFAARCTGVWSPTGDGDRSNLPA